MKKRLTIAALCLIAGLAVLLLLRRGPLSLTYSGAGSQAQKGPAALTAMEAPSLSPSTHKKTDPSPEPAIIEFDRVALPEVLNQLVKQAGITVTADLDDVHLQTLVTIQAFVPPLEALQMVADEYQLELLQTDSGWWLRPVPAIQEVTYQPSIPVDEKRTQQLLENLQKIIGVCGKSADESVPPAASITIDREGIHVTGSKLEQNMASAYIETCVLAWGGRLTSRREKIDISADPAVPQK